MLGVSGPGVPRCVTPGYMPAPRRGAKKMGKVQLKTRLTIRSKSDTVEPPNKPTEGSGPRVTLYPFLSVEYVCSYAKQVDKTTLADRKSCPNIGDHLRFSGMLPVQTLLESI